MTIIDSPEGLTPEALSGMLGADVTSVEWEPVGSGQMGACYRLRLDGADGVPRRLVAKMAARDEGARSFHAPAYRNEVLFYRDVASTVDVRTPRCHHAELADDHQTFLLLLEDAHPAVQGDQITGCTARQAAGAVTNLAGLHGPRWCDPALRDVPWLPPVGEEDAKILGEVFAPAVETFTDRFTGSLDSEDVRTLRRTAEVVAAWVVGRPERFGLVHGDYRLDNLLFPPGSETAPPEAAPPGGVTAVDWQTLSLGHPVRDLAFFLVTSLLPDDRAGHERSLVQTYHQALTGYGVRDYSLDECFEDYRFAALQGPLITVLGCAYGSRTERGDQMFLAMTRRSCAAIRELDSFELV